MDDRDIITSDQIKESIKKTIECSYFFGIAIKPMKSIPVMDGKTSGIEPVYCKEYKRKLK